MSPRTCHTSASQVQAPEDLRRRSPHPPLTIHQCFFRPRTKSEICIVCGKSVSRKEKRMISRSLYLQYCTVHMACCIERRTYCMMYIMRCRILCSIYLSLSLYSINPIPILITFTSSSFFYQLYHNPINPPPISYTLLHQKPLPKISYPSHPSHPSLPSHPTPPRKNVPHPPNPLPLRPQRQHPNPMPRQPRKRFHATLSSTWNSEYGSSAAGRGFA